MAIFAPAGFSGAGSVPTGAVMAIFRTPSFPPKM